MPVPAVVLVRGDDAVLVRDAARAAIDEAVGEADRSLVLTELAGDEYELAALVDAAQTPPFLTDLRVVVGRDLQRFTAEQLGPLVVYLDAPLDTTRLVLVWQGGGRIPKALTDAIGKAGGEVRQSTPASGKAGRRQWLDDQLGRVDIRLDGGARALLDDTVGDDLARVPSLLATLEAVYGPGARLHRDDVAPYLGGAGAVPPWELTDAIDGGRVGDAVDKLHRLLAGGDRHPLQVMVTLVNHVERMLALSGSGAATERQAAELLGMKGSTFPARKALDQSRRLGPARIARAVELLADADLALRGGSAWPPELVMEVLVARLARLAR